MKNDDIYKLKIDAYTPETIPMARLAGYLLELSSLFGEKDSVHFNGLDSGSTQIVSRVQYEAAPKVRDRVSIASTDDEDQVIAKAYSNLNEMLREDNADATLSRNGSNVLIFPGRRSVRHPKMGPFTQDAVKDGVLIRIGGKDKSAHATIEESDGTPWRFEITRTLAKQLAPYLFGKPVRLIGQGRFYRDETGQWKYNSLRAAQFKVLDDAPLAEVVERIRRLTADTWQPDVDAIALMTSLRDDASGACKW